MMVTEKRVLSFKGVASGRLTKLHSSEGHTFKRKWAAQTIIDGLKKKRHKDEWVGKGGLIWEELETGGEFDQNTLIHDLTHHYTVDFDSPSSRHYLRFK